MAAHDPNDPSTSWQVREAIFKNAPERGELGQKNSQTEEENRPKLLHQQLGKLSVTGQLERVRYGSWKNKPACLIMMRFQFNAKASRFTKATVQITFGRREEIDPEEAADIKAFGPKELLGERTVEQRQKHSGLTGTFGITNPVTATLGPDVSRDSTFDKIHRRTVWAYAKPEDVDDQLTNQVTWKLTENKKDHGEGLGSVFRTVMVVRYNGPFQAAIDVSAHTSPDFFWLARPWTKDDPVLFREGYSYGEPLSLEHEPRTFSDMTDVDWSELLGPLRDEASVQPPKQLRISHWLTQTSSIQLFEVCD